MFPTEPRTVSVACTNYKFFSLKNTPGFSLEFLSVPVQVLSSNNVLVLCSDDPNNHKTYYVCNPLIKSWVTIPTPPSPVPRAHVGFICKPSYFDACSCSFVIVRVASYDKNPNPWVPTLVETYSSDTRQWVEYNLEDAWKGFKKRIFGSYSATRQPYAVICKGLVHWIGFPHVFVYDPDNNNNINNKFRVAQLPGNNEVQVPHLAEGKGNLIYINFSHPTFNAWKLKDYDNNGEWELLHKVCLDQMAFCQPSLINLFGWRTRMHFLAFHPFSEDAVFICAPPLMLSFNMREKTIKYVCRVPREQHFVDRLIPYLVVLPWWPLQVSLEQPNILTI